MPFPELWAFIRKDILLEWRQRAALGSVLLYLLSTAFVCYLAFDGLVDLAAWNALFWLIMLFSGISAVQKSFVQESGSHLFYYYTLLSARGVINAKIAYNTLLLFLLSLAGLAVFMVFMGNPIESFWLFLVNMTLGMMGFSVILTLVSSIAAATRNNFTLMAVMGFPLVLPLLLMLIRVSSLAVAGAAFAEVMPELVILVLLVFIAMVLSNLLFPYIWKE